MIAPSTTHGPKHASGQPAAGPALRTDIQGLRAVAVLSVVLYHLWPNRLTGGFVGVDVFFVISGFLITSHLLASPPRVPLDLVRFWSRRIRRLLPASLLVLLVTLAASRIVAPETQWENTANQVKAAALYVVNWRLASDSVDYLAAESAASPVQHFWSLSVEEQFYLGWPVLLLVLFGLAALAARKVGYRPSVVGGGLVLVVAASFVYSIHLTGTDPSRAYFVTPTRIWELGVGGLLAALVVRRAFDRPDATARLPVPARIALAWAGLALMLYAVVTYDGSTPFPGWQAAVPVVGTALVIAGRAPERLASPGWWLARRPMQWLGDVSYSVYLWHWPLIVLLPAATGSRLGLLDKVAIMLATAVLATLTKRFVEDRFRRPVRGRALRNTYVLAAAAMAVVVGASLLQVNEVQRRDEQADRALRTALASNDPCFGAPALGNSACKPVNSGRLTPEPIAAARDKSHAYADVSGKSDCFAYLPRFRDVRCSFGRPGGTVRVALVGNSHAGQWVDAIDAIAKASGWRMTTYLASQCASSDVRQTFSTAAQSAACQQWVRRTTREVAAADYDLVIITNRISVTATGENLQQSQATYRDGYRPVLRAIRGSGARVVAIRDTPAPNKSIPDCLAANTDAYDTCDGTRARWVPGDPMVAAIRELRDPGATLVDLTNRICLPVVCPAETGGVPVYFDGSHLTTTYARTLAPYLAPALRAAVSR